MESNAAGQGGPETLMQLQMGMMRSRVLSAAVQLDLFSRMAEGSETASDIARAMGASERGSRMLLDSLCALGLLGKADARYRLLPASRTYLVRSSPDYIGALMETDELWHAWGNLAGAVKSGRPVRPVEGEENAEAFFSILIRSLDVLNREPARRLAQALGAGRTHRGLSVLDVGAGSAVWSTAVAEADPDARVTALDFAGVLRETRKFVERRGLGNRFDYLAGDLREVALPAQHFDLAILGNIVHSEGEHSGRRLFNRLHTALRSGGRVAIIEFVPAEDRTGPAPAVLFALEMLVHTEEGDVYTFEELQAWLMEAGFSRVETADIGGEAGTRSPAIIATKSRA